MKERKNNEIKYELQFMQANCRSIVQKTESLIEYFDNTKIKFGLLTETWTDRNSESRIKERLEKEHGIGFLARSRGGRGGGVAIAFRKSEMEFKLHEFFTGEYEVIASSAKIPGTGARLFVFCTYYPPSMLVEDVKKMNELIYDEVLKLKIKYEKAFFIIAGDMNKKKCDCFAEFNDFVLVKSAPTRKNECLDICYTNLFVQSSDVSIPLWSDAGVDSDHLVVMYNAAYIGQKFTYKTIVRPKVTERANEEFCMMVEGCDWSELSHMATADEMTDFFHMKIEQFKAECFPLKKSRIRSDEDPWVTDHIRRCVKKRNLMFRYDGRGERWKTLRDDVRLKLENAKNAYYDREVEKIFNASDKKSLAFTALKNLSCPDRPKQWAVTDIEKAKDETTVVEELAEYFNSVTKDYMPVDVSRVQKTYDRPIYEITPDMVETRIRQTRKPNSSVPGDIPPKLMNRLAAKISSPVSRIFNAVVREMQWPLEWKTEYQTIIPKVQNPSEYGQLRNLSCTNFLSKILESFVADSIRSEIELSDLQYGGIKGCGTDNFLMEMWNNILETLDCKDTAVSLMSVDFSKAFNRLDHQACLDKLVKKNASNQTISLIAAFLGGRKMCVRTSNVMSEKRLVLGGSPQGTKLGNMLFCIAIDDITEFVKLPETRKDSPERAIPPQYMPLFASTPGRNVDADDSFNPNPYGFRRKINVIGDSPPFDRLPGDQYSETSTWEIGYIDDLNIGETIRVSDGESHITTSKEIRSIRALGCEEMYEIITENGTKVGMLINAKKTQLLCISSSLVFRVECFISIDGRKLTSGEKLKILGFMFDGSPTPKAHIEHLIMKFNRSLWTLFHLRRAKLREEILVGVYKAMLRPLLEYGSNVFSTMLNEEEKDRLESCQKKALKIIYGFEMSYNKMLEESSLEDLSTRRKNMFEKFCLKSSKSERFRRKWLPQKETEDTRTLRKTNKYIEFKAKTNRLYNSPLFAMRRFMNSMTRN